jgi:hypothetical protein
LPDRLKERSEAQKQSTKWLMWVTISYIENVAHIKVMYIMAQENMPVIICCGYTQSKILQR